MRAVLRQGTQAMQALQQMLQQMLQQLLQLMLHLLQLLECLCVIKVFLYFWHIHCSRVSQLRFCSAAFLLRFCV